MRHTIGEGEVIEIEIEIPSLAFFADTAIPEATQDTDRIAATLADMGMLVPEHDAWAQASEAASRTIDGVVAEGLADAHRFHFRVRIPESGSCHLFKLSVFRAGTALDASGTRRDPQLHPTEQLLIGVMTTTAAPDSADQQASALPIPGRRGVARVTPGATIVRAITQNGVTTLAQENNPDIDPPER